MIVYPRISFLTGSIAPLTPAEKVPFENLSITELADSAYSDSNLFTSFETKNDRCISSNAVFQGAITGEEINLVYNQL